MLRRGDIVLVAFPYSDGTRGKVRPALVVQSDRNNRRLKDTVVAMITGNTRFAGTEPTQFLIDQKSGVHGPSAVRCESLCKVAQSSILRTLGGLTSEQMTGVDACLRHALEL
jgi:mRNA interferase MazF